VPRPQSDDGGNGDSPSGKGLSEGAIVAIVITAIVVAGIVPVVVAIVRCRPRVDAGQNADQGRAMAAAHHNPAYDNPTHAENTEA